MASNPKQSVAIEVTSFASIIPIRANYLIVFKRDSIPAPPPDPYAEVLSAIDQFRARRCKQASSEPKRIIAYEQEVWDSFHLTGALDHTRLLQECQMRVQLGEDGAEEILKKLHEIHRFRHKNRAKRWELPFNHQSWQKLEEVAPDPQHKAMVGPRLWALLIGNDQYPQYPLQSAVKDSLDWKSYLIDYLGVPEKQIKLKKNAKRKTMINSLYDLRDNDLIRRGDHILFAYSGQAQTYGAKAYSLEEEINERAGSIEALCPVDRGFPLRDGSHVPDISDREVLLILSEIRERTQANITVVLDCDYSGGFTKAKRPQPMDGPPVAPLDDNAHEMLLMADQHDRRLPSTISVRSPTWAIDTDLYRPVVLAACQDTERAWEWNGRGRFTSAILRVLRSEKGREITCSGLIKAIGPLRHDQKPRFDGEDRILFGVNRRS